METVRKNKGFTLVELIVVIAIVAILAAVGIVGYSQFIKEARNSNARNELNQVYNVIFVDAAKPDELKEYDITTSGGKLVFEFGDLDNEQIANHLESLLGRYLDAGFYQGKFIFTEDMIYYDSPSGGHAEREIEFNFGVEVTIIVKDDGTFDVTHKTID